MTEATSVVSPEIAAKLTALEQLLRKLAPVAVGFSGGVDSTFLAAVCARALPDRAVLIHLDTPFIATPERQACAENAEGFGLPVHTIALDPLADERIARNDPERCYWCKRAGFTRIIEAARALGCATVVDGSNADDAGDYRPGMRALRELGARSPLMETGWHKDEERALLRAWGYAVWNMPAGACLATRVATGESLSAGALDAARACEDLLHARGCIQVRARIAQGTMRIEASPSDLAVLAGPGDPVDASGGRRIPDDLLAELKGRANLSVDPIARPYRHGAMNAPGVTAPR